MTPATKLWLDVETVTSSRPRSPWPPALSPAPHIELYIRPGRARRSSEASRAHSSASLARCAAPLPAPGAPARPGKAPAADVSREMSSGAVSFFFLPPLFVSWLPGRVCFCLSGSLTLLTLPLSFCRAGGLQRLTRPLTQPSSFSRNFDMPPSRQV